MIDITKIRPMGDRVLIKRDAHDARTKGGLVIPDAVQGRYGSQTLRRGRGVVLAVGPGEHRKVGKVHRRWTQDRIPLDVRPGDVVVFSILLTLGDLDELGLPDHTLISEAEIEAVLEGEMRVFQFLDGESSLVAARNEDEARECYLRDMIDGPPDDDMRVTEVRRERWSKITTTADDDSDSRITVEQLMADTPERDAFVIGSTAF